MQFRGEILLCIIPIKNPPRERFVHKYVKTNYDRLDLTVPKGQKDAIKAHADEHGESVNGFINRAITETMELYKE